VKIPGLAFVEINFFINSYYIENDCTQYNNKLYKVLETRK
jgi:hypothetical protein